MTNKQLKTKRKKQYEDYPIPDKCCYCGGEIFHTTNDYIYGKLYGKAPHKIYVCTSCKASVGTHPDGITPLGRLADKNLKTLKMKAHGLFDPYFQSGQIKRTNLYMWLAERMDIPVRECHFGWFDEEQLLQAIKILETEKPIMKEG